MVPPWCHPGIGVGVPPWYGVGGASVRCTMCRGAEAVLSATERRSSVCDAVLTRRTMRILHMAEGVA